MIYGCFMRLLSVRLLWQLGLLCGIMACALSVQAATPAVSAPEALVVLDSCFGELTRRPMSSDNQKTVLELTQMLNNRVLTGNVLGGRNELSTIRTYGVQGLLLDRASFSLGSKNLKLEAWHTDLREWLEKHIEAPYEGVQKGMSELWQFLLKMYDRTSIELLQRCLEVHPESYSQRGTIIYSDVRDKATGSVEYLVSKLQRNPEDPDSGYAKPNFGSKEALLQKIADDLFINVYDIEGSGKSKFESEAARKVLGELRDAAEKYWKKLQDGVPWQEGEEKQLQTVLEALENNQVETLKLDTTDNDFEGNCKGFKKKLAKYIFPASPSRQNFDSLLNPNQNLFKVQTGAHQAKLRQLGAAIDSVCKAELEKEVPWEEDEDERLNEVLEVLKQAQNEKIIDFEDVTNADLRGSCGGFKKKLAKYLFTDKSDERRQGFGALLKPGTSLFKKQSKVHQGQLAQLEADISTICKMQDLLCAEDVAALISQFNETTGPYGYVKKGKKIGGDKLAEMSLSTLAEFWGYIADKSHGPFVDKSKFQEMLDPKNLKNYTTKQQELLKKLHEAILKRAKKSGIKS